MIDVPTLIGSLVRLEPLTTRHLDDLIAAAAVDRSTYSWTSVPDGAAAMATYVDTVIADPTTLAFVQVQRADDRAVGVTRLLAPHVRPDDPTPFAVEIGGTWLGSEAQRTGINREAKLLLLTHVFDVWQVDRVDIRTDARNARSRAAIERIGARLDGVLRSWEPSRVVGEESLLRDTAVYSIVPAEWPGIRDRLAGTRVALPE